MRRKTVIKLWAPSHKEKWLPGWHLPLQGRRWSSFSSYSYWNLHKIIQNSGNISSYLRKRPCTMYMFLCISSSTCATDWNVCFESKSRLLFPRLKLCDFTWSADLNLQRQKILECVMCTRDKRQIRKFTFAWKWNIMLLIWLILSSEEDRNLTL